jgi:hypothetical protein
MATLLRRWLVALGVSATNRCSPIRKPSSSLLFVGWTRRCIKAVSNRLLAHRFFGMVSAVATAHDGKFVGLVATASFVVFAHPMGAAFFEEGFFRGYAIPKLTNLLRSPLIMLHGRFGFSFLSPFRAHRRDALLANSQHLLAPSTWSTTGSWTSSSMASSSKSEATAMLRVERLSIRLGEFDLRDISLEVREANTSSCSVRQGRARQCWWSASQACIAQNQGAFS